MDKILKEKLLGAKFLDCVVEEKQIDKAERTITGYVSTKSLDRDRDIILPEAFDLTNYRKNPIVLFNHDWYLPGIATSLWQKPDEVGLLSKSKFGTTPFADDIYTLFLEDIIRAFSVGFGIKQGGFEVDADTGVTTYTDVELYEYSAVNIPSNTDALREASKMVKSLEARSVIEKQNMDSVIKGRMAELENQVKELQKSYNELIVAKEYDFVADLEKLEHKVAKLEKVIFNLTIENLKKNFGKSGEILGINVEKLVAGNITRAKENK